MAEIRRFTLNFNLDVPWHREAWEVLHAIPAGHRTDAICNALRQQHQNAQLKTTIKEVVQAELQNVKISEPEDAQDDAVLGFLRTLQGDDAI
jgi:hypothetical protein